MCFVHTPHTHITTHITPHTYHIHHTHITPTVTHPSSLQPCMHSYCAGCYSDWMAVSNKCPAVSSIELSASCLNYNPPHSLHTPSYTHTIPIHTPSLYIPSLYTHHPSTHHPYTHTIPICTKCRNTVERISKNHIVNNLAMSYLKANPGRDHMACV